MGSFSLAESKRESWARDSSLGSEGEAEPARAEFAKDGNFGVESGGAYHPKMSEIRVAKSTGAVDLGLKLVGEVFSGDSEEGAVSIDELGEATHDGSIGGPNDSSIGVGSGLGWGDVESTGLGGGRVTEVYEGGASGWPVGSDDVPSLVPASELTTASGIVPPEFSSSYLGFEETFEESIFKSVPSFRTGALTCSDEDGTRTISCCSSSFPCRSVSIK
ncbi:hypothetical protein HAX54_035067, partial [Datura stramonium]|nr:hypothetical protein [Datura stramonium]